MGIGRRRSRDDEIEKVCKSVLRINNNNKSGHTMGKDECDSSLKTDVKQRRKEIRWRL